MTAPDDISKGDYIVIVGRRNDLENWRGHPTRRYNGAPMYVHAVSQPFAAVECFGNCFSIDLRFFIVHTVTKEYATTVERLHNQHHECINPDHMNDEQRQSYFALAAKQLLLNDPVFAAQVLNDPQIRHAMNNRPAGPHENDCPRCGNRMRNSPR